MKQCKCGKLLLHAERKYKQDDECAECYFNNPDRFKLMKGFTSVLMGTYILNECLDTLEILSKVKND